MRVTVIDLAFSFAATADDRKQRSERTTYALRDWIYRGPIVDPVLSYVVLMLVK